MNLIENGNFETRELSPWEVTEGDSADVVFPASPTDKAALFKKGMAFRQPLDAAAINEAPAFALQARGRAVPGTESNPTRTVTAIYLMLQTITESEEQFYTFVAEMHQGWTTFSHDFYFQRNPEPIIEAWFHCELVLVDHIYPEQPHVPLDTWLTGFELSIIDEGDAPATLQKRPRLPGRNVEPLKPSDLPCNEVKGPRR